MADLTPPIGPGTHASGYTAPVAPAPAAAPNGPAAPAADTRHAAVPATGTEHSEVVTGFNPSVTIDPDTHIVVMTIRSPDGETLRQIPNQHELAAYKARAVDQKKGTKQS
ncbi:MAG: hypothetical protein WCO00_07700 [Rhodospirillaceae bacterium]